MPMPVFGEDHYTVGIVASERQLAGIVNLNDRYQTARPPEWLSRLDPQPSVGRSKCWKADVSPRSPTSLRANSAGLKTGSGAIGQLRNVIARDVPDLIASFTAAAKTGDVGAVISSGVTSPGMRTP